MRRILNSADDSPISSRASRFFGSQLIFGFFLSQQFQDLPALRVVSCFRQQPAEALQIFAVDELFHENFPRMRSALVEPAPNR
jgi:hypothetical protein